MRTLRSLYRYPVKGLSPEPLDAVDVRAGEGFPGDRTLAITNGGWVYDAASYRPRPKTDFVMLMLHESLAALRTRLDDSANELHVTTPDGQTHAFAVGDAAALERLSDFVAGRLPGRLPGRPQLVRSQMQRFTDVAVTSAALMQSVSLIGLASVRELARALGRDALNPLRFRANLYYDGGEPWEELAWLDREIRIGAVRARVVRRTRRCAATNVDPERGVRDVGIPQALAKHFGHGDMGVYLELLDAGRLRPGDSVLPPE